MALVLPSLRYDRAAIMRSAWAEFRERDNFVAPGCYRRPFGVCLAYAWRVARNLRSRMADGTDAREHAQAAAREVLRRQLWASLTDEQRETADAWLIRQCSTDGRLPCDPHARR